MEAIDTKAMKGIRSYLERRGFEILEEEWAHDGDIIDFIASEEGDLVFIVRTAARDSPRKLSIATPSSGWRRPTSPNTSTLPTARSGSTS